MESIQILSDLFLSVEGLHTFREGIYLNIYLEIVQYNDHFQTELEPYNLFARMTSFDLKWPEEIRDM